MAKGKAKGVKQAEVAVADQTSEPVDVAIEQGPDGEDDSDVIVQEPVVTKQPLVYLQQPELREAWVDILTLRVLKQPIPEHLAINDHLGFTNPTNARRVLEMMGSAGVDVTQKNVRKYADKVLPKA